MARGTIAAAVMNLNDVGALPPTLTAPQVAEIWNVDTDTVYDGNQRGDLPVMPLKLGRALRWPTVQVLRSVGIDHAA